MKIDKVLLLSLLTGFMVSCQNGIETTDAVYFTGTESNNVVSMYVDGPTSYPVSVTSSALATSDFDVNVAVDPTALDAYNQQNNSKYVILPEGSYKLSADHMTIKANSNTSLPISVQLLSLDNFEEGVTYCLPLSLQSTSNGMGILPTSKNMFVIMKPYTISQGWNLAGSGAFYMPTIKDNAKMKNLIPYTMECRFKLNSYGWGIASVIGHESWMCQLRFGNGVDVPTTTMQAFSKDVACTLDYKFMLNKWYHIAMTDNGSEATIYINGEKVQTFTTGTSSSPNDCTDMYIGNIVGGGRPFDGIITEVRLWDRVLSPLEIKNNECYVDPNTEGLMGYWRMNEIENGTTVKDLSPNHFDAVGGGGSGFEPTKCPVIE